MMKNYITWFLACSILILVEINYANAQVTTIQSQDWIGTIGNWEDPVNWAYTYNTPQALPVATIANGGTAILNQGINASLQSLGLGSSSANSGSLQMNGGSLWALGGIQVGSTGTGIVNHSSGGISGGGINIGGDPGSSGTYNLSAGSLSLYGTLGVSGAGNFTQSDGTVDAFSLEMDGKYDLTAGQLSTSGNQEVGGIFTQSGGTNHNWGSLVIDNNGTYNLSAGQLSVDLDQELEGFFNQSGGTNTTNFLFIGGNVGSSGTYNLTAGQLTGNLFIGRFGGTGTLTQSGGLIVENSLLGLAFGLESGSGGTYNLNGGVIILQNIRLGPGTVAFNFGGGTLQASGDFNSTLPMMLTGIGGNANVDTAGHLVTLSGQLGGAGGLNKLGTGTLDLLGNNSYTGDTNVIDGTLSEKMPCLNDLAAVRLSSDAKLDLNFTGTDAVGTLYLDGLPMALGTWGSSLSPATHIDDTHFSGSGMLNVTAVPEPSTIALLFTAAFGGLLWWRRRR